MEESEEASEKCAVPFCYGLGSCQKPKIQVHIKFPSNYATQQLWWQALGVEHKEYTTNAFICRRHFNLEEDLVKSDWEYYLKHKNSLEDGRGVLPLKLRVESNMVPYKFVLNPPDVSSNVRRKQIKRCMVKACNNNSVNAPNKLFLEIPRNRKDVWLRTTECCYCRYCCEDHFDLNTDMENYMQHKMMGGRIRLKRGVVPHIFQPKAKDLEFAACGRTEKGDDASNNREGSVLIHLPQIVKVESVLPTNVAQVISSTDDSRIFKSEPNSDFDEFDGAIDRANDDESGSSGERKCSLTTFFHSDVKNELPFDDGGVQNESSNNFLFGPTRDIKNEIFLDEVMLEELDDQLILNANQFETNTPLIDQTRALAAIEAQLKQNPKITTHPVVGSCKFDSNLPPGSSFVDNFLETNRSNKSYGDDVGLLPCKKVKHTSNYNNSSSVTAVAAVKAELLARNPKVIIHPVVGPCKVALVLPSAASPDPDNSIEECRTLHRSFNDDSVHRCSDVEKTSGKRSYDNCTALSVVKAQLMKQNPRVIIHPVVGPCKVALVLPSASS